jgi:hypothetical protein
MRLIKSLRNKVSEISGILEPCNLMRLNHILRITMSPILNLKIKNMNMKPLTAAENQPDIRVILLNLLQHNHRKIIGVLNTTLTRLIIPCPMAVRSISQIRININHILR